MRFDHLRNIIVSCLMVCATGCVCVDRRGCAPYGTACGGCSTGTCDPCNSGCDNCVSAVCGGCSESYFGPGPLMRLLSHQTCASKFGCGGGCGELYVDEWINERPCVDNCGCGECTTCGQQPVRSLLSLLWGDRYRGGCETGCCDGGIDLSQPLIYDGFDPHAWKSNRGCNCGSNPTSVSHSSSSGEETVIEKTEPTPTPSKVAPTPEAAKPTTNTTRTGPTPAPPIPKSALRLNPASRKVTR